MDIKCAYTELLDANKVVLNSKNRNNHSENQIERLSEMIKYYGIRHAIIINKETGVCIAGEGRFLAMQRLGIDKIPVDYQDFKDQDEAQQFSIADNEIARWSDPDLSGINADLIDWGPDFDIEMLGMTDFKLDPVDKIDDAALDDIFGSESDLLKELIKEFEAEVTRRIILFADLADTEAQSKELAYQAIVETLRNQDDASIIS